MQKTALAIAAAVILALSGSAAFAGPVITGPVLEVREMGTFSQDVTLGEGESVTVGLFLSNMPDFGLGGFSVSIATFTEMADGTPVAGGVLDAVASALSNPVGETLGGSGARWLGATSDGTLQSLPADGDADTDLRAMSAVANLTLDVGGQNAYVKDLGTDMPILLGEVTLTALASGLGFPRTVFVHTFITDDAGSNGGAALSRLTADTENPNANSLSAVPSADINLGGGVSVTVLPEPATLVLLGLGAGGLILRRRRR